MDVFRICVTAIFLTLAGLASAQDRVTLTPDEMRQLATNMLVSDQAAEAAVLADALLARDAEDIAALVIRARAALALEDFDTAIAMSRRAYAASVTDDERFTTARLTALSHAAVRRDTFAQFWLRRAGQYAPTEEARAAVADDYQYLRQRNPLAISLSFGISPSSNVNGGSASEILVLPGLPFEFVLDGEARALSGIQFSGGVTLTYRLRSTDRDAVFVDASIQGRTYTLSAEARELAPDARGSDYSDISFVTSLTRRWLSEGSRGPWTVNAALGQTWYDNAPYLRFLRLSLAKGIRFDSSNRLDMSTFAEGQDRLDDDEQFVTLGAGARWTHVGPSGNQSTLLVSVRDSLTDIEDVGFRGLTLSGDYDLRQPIGGLRIGLGADAEIRDFDQSAYSFDGRQDITGTLRVTIGLPGIQYYGFEPTVTLETSRTSSDVDLFDKRDLRVNFGIRSSF
jgi:hypothetical protein